MTHSSGAMPAWLQFDPFSRQISGTLTSVDMNVADLPATETFTVTAQDSYGLSASTPWQLLLQAVPNNHVVTHNFLYRIKSIGYVISLKNIVICQILINQLLTLDYPVFDSIRACGWSIFRNKKYNWLIFN